MLSADGGPSDGGPSDGYDVSWGAPGASDDQAERITPRVVSLVAAAHAASAARQRSPVILRICAEADHYTQRAGQGSNSTCGYRNCQILASSLMRYAPFREVLFAGDGAVPGVPALMRCIELAWARGFDPPGRAEMGGELFYGKWIGTAEAAVLFRSFGINARLITFHAFDSPDIATVSNADVASRAAVARAAAEAELLRDTGLTAEAVLHPWKYKGQHGARPAGRAGGGGGGGAASGGEGSGGRPVAAGSPGSQASALRRFMARRHAALLGWLQAHFQSSAASPSASAPFPVYLQHDGHSRTLAGYELRQVSSAAAGGHGGGDAKLLQTWLGGGLATASTAAFAAKSLAAGPTEHPSAPTPSAAPGSSALPIPLPVAGVKRPGGPQPSDVISISSGSDGDDDGIGPAGDEVAFVSSTARGDVRPPPPASRRFVASPAAAARPTEKLTSATEGAGVAHGSLAPSASAAQGHSPPHASFREFLGGAVRGYSANPDLFDSELLLIVLDPASNSATLSAALTSQRYVHKPGHDLSPQSYPGLHSTGDGSARSSDLW